MSDNSSQFTLDVNINTKDAQKQTDSLKEKVNNVDSQISKKRNMNVDGSSATSAINKVGGALSGLSNEAGIATKELGTLFSLGAATPLGAIIMVLTMIIKLIQAVGSVSHEIVNLTNKAIGLNISTNALKAWEVAFQSIGKSAEEADSALASIQDRLMNQLINPSLDVANAFAALGISMVKSNGQLKDALILSKELAQKSVVALEHKDLRQLLLVHLASGWSNELVRVIGKNPNLTKEFSKIYAKNIVTNNEISGAKSYVKSEAERNAAIDKLKFNLANEGVVNSINNAAKDIRDLTFTLNRIINAFNFHPINKINQELQNVANNPSNLIGNFLPTPIGDMIHQFNIALSNKKSNNNLSKFTKKDILGLVSNASNFNQNIVIPKIKDVAKISSTSTPYSAKSPNVHNNILNKISYNNNTTHIGTVNVKADHPSDLNNWINRNNYNSRELNQSSNHA